MKILIITPGITEFPASMGDSDSYLTAKADGVSDQFSHLFAALAKQGVDVHIAMPNYLRIIRGEKISLVEQDLAVYKNAGVPDNNIYLIEKDELFAHHNVSGTDNANIAFALQNNVLEKIIPNVKPELIHCIDWLTGLIPAATRTKRIPCLLTLHNMHTYEAPFGEIEGSGISARDFWPRLYFKRMPHNEREAIDNNTVDLLASAIFSAHFVHTGSPTFIDEIAAGRHNFIPGNIVAEIINKKHAKCAEGIRIPIDPELSPQSMDDKYDSENATNGKLASKKKLQAYCGLDQTDTAPLFFWPSRLDAHQKGCHLLTDILYETIDKFWKHNLQIVIIANGVYKRKFDDIVRMHSLSRRVAVRTFAEYPSRLAYAASDFLLLPSLYDVCGMNAMTGLIYGSLPVAHDTGGLHDTIKPLRVDCNEGNGFLFQVHNAEGLRLAIEHAMVFYRLPVEKKAQQISRIMKQSQKEFNIDEIASNYINLYEKMQKHPMAI